MPPTTHDLERVEDLTERLKDHQERMAREFAEVRTTTVRLEERLKLIARLEAVIAILLSALVTLAGIDTQRTIGFARKVLDSGMVGTSTQAR